GSRRRRRTCLQFSSRQRLSRQRRARWHEVNDASTCVRIELIAVGAQRPCSRMCTSLLVGGINTAGTSISVVMESDKHLRLVDAYEEWGEKNAGELVKTATAQGAKVSDPLVLKLVIAAGGWYAFDEAAQVRWRLP